MSRKALLSMLAALLMFASLAGSAMASDHLLNAANSSGTGERGFTNPVATNPSGTSGPAASPATVPGEGNPNFGLEQGTPSVDLGLVSDRSDGNGSPTGAQ